MNSNKNKRRRVGSANTPVSPEGVGRRTFLRVTGIGGVALALGCTQPDLAVDGGSPPDDGSAGGPATAVRLSAPSPSTGIVNVPSRPFTVSANGTLAAAVVVTPNDGGSGGTFTPASVTLSASTPSQPFSYTAPTTGVKTIRVANDGGLMDPAPITFTVGDVASSADQFLTHDGDGAGRDAASSAPTNLMWNSVLGFRWKRGVWGDWLDANQDERGLDAAGAVPYASVAVPEPARYSVDVTTLVQRWITTGENRGFYLRTRGNPFPVRFAGRTATDVESRPALTVTTSAGTLTLTARCNAGWATTTTQVVSSSDTWQLADGQPAILHFDLTMVVGPVTAASLAFTDTEHEMGSTSRLGTVDIFEADPPRFIVPDVISAPELGIAARYPTFAAMASDPDVLFSDDFEAPGWADVGWDHPVERALNATTNTTYARGQFVAGENGSSNLRSDVSEGTGADGAPNRVVEELFGQYNVYFESDFGSNVDSIKIPAMGVQFGYWNPVGYWQQTTGNGGSPGTGLKVWNASRSQWEYQGHSVRFLMGQRPADASAYDGLFGIGIYPYNLDQVGPFPAGESFPYIGLRREQWYSVDIQVKQNSITGPYDADGNGTAQGDGEYRVWINGLPVYERTDYRWRRHPDFGVQGMWIDFYHGGVQPAPYPMHYRVDRVTLATSYIGPRT